MPAPEALYLIKDINANIITAAGRPKGLHTDLEEHPRISRITTDSLLLSPRHHERSAVGTSVMTYRLLHAKAGHSPTVLVWKYRQSVADFLVSSLSSVSSVLSFRSGSGTSARE